MNPVVEYQRDLAHPTAMRVASHFTSAARRLATVALAGAPATQAFMQAQAQDITFMTGDALTLLPGLNNVDNPALHPAVAALATQMQQMNAQMQQMSAQMQQMSIQMQQMHAQLTAQMQQMNAQMQQMSDRIDHLSLTVSLAMNSNACHLSDGVFLPFPNQANFIPAIFPRTTDQLKALTGPQMTELLHAYNVEGVPTALVARIQRVKRLITTGT